MARQCMCHHEPLPCCQLNDFLCRYDMYCWVIMETCFSFMFVACFLLPMMYFHFGHVVLCIFSCCSWFKLIIHYMVHDDNFLIGCLLCHTILYPMRIFYSVLCLSCVQPLLFTCLSPSCSILLCPWDHVQLVIPFDSFAVTH